MNKAVPPAALKLDESESKAVRLEGSHYREQQNPLLIFIYLGSVSAMYILYCFGCTGNTSHMGDKTSRHSK